MSTANNKGDAIKGDAIKGTGAQTGNTQKTVFQRVDEAHTVGFAAFVLAGATSGVAALVYATTVEDSKARAKTLGGTAEFFISSVHNFDLPHLASISLPCAVGATGLSCVIGASFGAVAGLVWPVAVPIGAVIYLADKTKDEGNEGTKGKA